MIVMSVGIHSCQFMYLSVEESRIGSRKTVGMYASPYAQGVTSSYL